MYVCPFHSIIEVHLFFYLHKYILHDKRYHDIDIKDVKFFPLSIRELHSLYASTKVLVDYSADDQSGLTMRTIESIGFGCKLITNNSRIVEADFYNPENIYVYDLENFNIPEGFIEHDYISPDDKILDYYCLEGWVNTLFEE